MNQTLELQLLCQPCSSSAEEKGQAFCPNCGTTGGTPMISRGYDRETGPWSEEYCSNCAEVMHA